MTNEWNFTYLIGAGASCEALPLIRDFPSALKEFRTEFDNNESFKNEKFSLYFSEISESVDQVRKEFLNDLDWLTQECSDHSSIDTLARKFYLSDQKTDLTKLKVLVNEFFIITQIFKGIDKRYDSFFAAILSGGLGKSIKLPENIKILSWNYDKQIEFSIGQFHAELINSNSVNEGEFVEDFIQVFPRKNQDQFDPGKFCLFKLNGTFGGALSKYAEYSQLDYSLRQIKSRLTENQKKNMRVMCLGRYKRNLKVNLPSGSDYVPSLYYAWEINPHVSKLREKAIQATSTTDFLVVIGYSFPTFNRETDKAILKSMPKLKKVYIQSPQNSIDGVVQRFKAVLKRETEIVKVTSVDEFHIPEEF